MAEIVEQVQEREAAEVSHTVITNETSSLLVEDLSDTLVSSPTPSGPRRKLPALQQPLCACDSLRWATSCSRPPQATEEAPSEGT